MKPTLVVLAAGMGSRFGGLKQIEPIGPQGEWILDFSVYDAVQAGFGKAVFVIRREMEAVFSDLRRRYEKSLEIALAFQELDDLPKPQPRPAERSKPWGTGHAVYAARQVISEPFAVINADDFYGREAFNTLAAFLRMDEEKECALVGYRLANTLSRHGSVSRGICIADASNRLLKVEEHTRVAYRQGQSGICGLNTNGIEVPLADDAIASMNCWGFPPAFLENLESSLSAFIKAKGEELGSEFHLPFAVDEMIANHQTLCRILPCSARWLGITHREDLEEAKREIAARIESGEYPATLWK